ncbi:hypothetical protein NDU88_005987 [Pleurodeles waltl]|uniref:Uncharacterized protein n=1 Tax=Pleurodeles waltl TaxID=8319 RepID=A0AAV7LMU9_PLEWA|nr:hypothetical protein NDU88_005987 [Pleurodeles waltl]
MRTLPHRINMLELHQKSSEVRLGKKREKQSAVLLQVSYLMSRLKQDRWNNWGSLKNKHAEIDSREVDQAHYRATDLLPCPVLDPMMLT